MNPRTISPVSRTDLSKNDGEKIIKKRHLVLESLQDFLDVLAVKN